MKKENKEAIILVAFLLIGIVIYFFGNNASDVQIIENENGTSSEVVLTKEPKQTNSVKEEDEVLSDLKVYFLDVGQGDCIFVENDGHTMLIDAGNNPDGKYVSKYLKKELGVSKIDYLIGTHAHEDHIGGIDIIIEDFDIGTFYMPKKESDNKCYKDVISWAKKKNVSIISPDIDTIFKVGNAICKVMSKKDEAEDFNECSIVVEMSYGKQKYLFTGDMEIENENSRKWNDIDVLKVSHHGSTYTTSNEFLDQVMPEIAVIMCGKDNEYYYPHIRLIERLEEHGCKDIYTTSEVGTVIITSNGIKNEVKCTKDLNFDGNK
jgi:competence protein ComEC